MTHTLRASCRPLTYVLCFLLIPLVVVYGPARPAQAAVVAIGPTVSVEVQTSNVFPGQAVKCSVTGYTRLHDTNLHSVRATVRCSYGFGREDLDRASLTARDADTSEANTCRFHQEDFSLIESTDTETTLTYNLSNPTLPDASCNLTTGVLHLQGSGGSFGRSPETFVFAWPLGALPQSSADLPPGEWSCPWASGTEPVIGPERYSSSGYHHLERDYGFDMTFGSENMPTASNWGVYPYLVVRSNARLGMTQDQPANGWNRLETNYSSSGDWNNNYTKDGRRYFVTSARSSFSPMSNWHGKDYQYLAQRFVSRYAERNDGAAIQSGYEVVGYGINITPGDSTVFSTAYPADATHHNYGAYVGWNSGTMTNRCAMYWGERISFADMSSLGATTVPLGPAKVSDGPPQSVEEPETLPVEDPGPADEPGCDGFSFTDPSSWAGAGICVMVKALRAIFYVLSDLLAAIGGIVGGLLDGIAALFMPDPQSFQDARDAMDFSDDPAITAWTDTLDGSDFFNTGPQAAQRSVEGGAAVPSMIPGVLLSGGCQGPGIDASALEMLGMEENLYPFNACSGAMATLAQWTRLLLMMFIGISGFLKIFEMIAVAIGAARQAQILGSFDWGNDHVVRKY